MAKQVILLLQRTDGRAEIMKETDLNFKVLPHPKGNVPVLFVDIGGDIFELQTSQPKKHGSWFVNQKVSSNANVYMASKIDPLFLCLPHFESRTQYSPLDQIITLSDESSGCGRMSLNNSMHWKLENIADVKDLGDDLILYRYNETKTMEWLKAKIQRVARHLLTVRKSRASEQTTSFVSTFNFSGQSSSSSSSSSTTNAVNTIGHDEPESQDIRMALQVVTDYLTESMTIKIVASFGMDAKDMVVSKSQTQKRKADWEYELDIEKETLAYALPPKRDAPVANTASSYSKTTTSAAAAAAKVLYFAFLALLSINQSINQSIIHLFLPM